MKKTQHGFLALIASSMLLVACGGGGQDIKADPLVIKKVADFSQKVDGFYASNGYGNGDPFGVEWSASEVQTKDNELHLSIHNNDAGKEWPYKGGEYRSTQFYGYGDFAVRMKPSATNGTASTFFTYTGEWDSETLHPSTGAGDTRNPDNNEGVHDEIDIEFLGKDTTHVQFNYFKSGKGGKEYLYNLGFDASKEWHTYGFRWEPTQITWFVDEKPVYRATDGIPTHPGRIISNFWAGNPDNSGIMGWMGRYDGKGADDAVYQFISSTGTAKETHKGDSSSSQGSDPSQSSESPADWDAIQPVDITVLNADDVYTTQVSSDKKAVEVTYEGLKFNTYKNVVLNVPEDKRSSSKVYFELENKGESSVFIRADVDAATTHGTNSIKAINTSATQDGNTAETDLEWGGSKFFVSPGTTSKAVINYDGEPVDLLLMIDSAWSTDSDTEHTGDIVIKNVKFDHVERPATSSEDSTPATSSDSTPATSEATSQDSSVAPAGLTVPFNGNGVYTCDNQPGRSVITYESVTNNTYTNAYAPLENIPEGTDRLAFTVKNNNTEDAVQISFGVGKNTEAGLVSAVIETDDIKYDYYEAGDKRAQLNIGAGASRDFVIAIDPTDGIDGIIAFINSTWAAEDTVHTNGNLEFLNVVFSIAE